MGRWRRCCCGAAAALVFHPGRVALAVGTGLAALAATLVGIPAATIVAREAGREDPGFVVVDEVAGQWIALIAVRPDWRHAVLALAAVSAVRYLEAVADSEAGGAAGGDGDHAGRCCGGAAGAGVWVGVGAVGLAKGRVFPGSAIKLPNLGHPLRG